MNLDKADVKIGVATEIGARIEDILEHAKKEVSRQEGMTAAFHQAAKVCEEIAKHIDKDLDEGKFESLPDGSLALAGLIKRYTDRCANAVRTLGQQSEAMQFIATGKAQAMEVSVKVVEKFRHEEVVKAETVRQAMAAVQANGSNGAHTNGVVPQSDVRPGLTIKERRLAEDAAAAAAAPSAETPMEAVEESASEPASSPKKRGRPPKRR